MTFQFGVRRVVCLAITGCLLSTAAVAIDIEPPNASVMDKFGVNVASGQVSHYLTTVSIGGELGLSHRISIFANEFFYTNMRGFSDNMRSVTRYVTLSQQAAYSPRTVLVVSDGSSSASFRVEKNGARVEILGGTAQPYTYVPVGDERHSLVVNGIYLDWTQPDGTLVRFTRVANATADAQGLLSQIVYPNGFTIDVTPGGVGIQSNTGYQLKGIYGTDSRPLTIDKVNNPDLLNVSTSLTSDGSGWSAANPIQIKAINTAIEFCTPAVQTCTTTNAWPTAYFEWPAGMPRTMYIGESTLRITDAKGGVTKYRYRAYDLAFNEFGGLEPCCTAGKEFSPRLVGVTPAGSTSERFTYDYKNIFTYNNLGFGTWVTRAQSSGVVISATDILKMTGYTMLAMVSGGPAYSNSTSGGGVNNVYMQGNATQGNPDAISYANVDDGQIVFESTARNWPTDFFKKPELGPPERYTYTRGNLTMVSRGSGSNYARYREAKYADSCTSSNFKYCNKPEWIKDAKGNVTNYTYHASSGQVASITSPPDKNGIRPETRYSYTQLRAKYFDGSGSKITGTPIWLKTAEKYCINSTYSSGACSGGDEVVTRYEYNHDNLQMTGMTVTDPSTGTTLRTCFQYDIYGNQIGKTLPKAGLTQCNQP